ncbi:MAG TPA: hypothetical protein VII64_12100 [Thermodesulfobacteriota bacterium]
MGSNVQELHSLLRDLRARPGYDIAPGWLKTNVDETIFLLEIGKSPHPEFVKKIAQYLEFEAAQDLRNSMLLDLLRGYLRELRHSR